jgi:hypothetical protein
VHDAPQPNAIARDRRDQPLRRARLGDVTGNHRDLAARGAHLRQDLLGFLGRIPAAVDDHLPGPAER